MKGGTPTILVFETNTLPKRELLVPQGLLLILNITQIEFYPAFVSSVPSDSSWQEMSLVWACLKSFCVWWIFHFTLLILCWVSFASDWWEGLRDMQCCQGTVQDKAQEHHKKMSRLFWVKHRFISDWLKMHSLLIDSNKMNCPGKFRLQLWDFSVEEYASIFS